MVDEIEDRYFFEIRFMIKHPAIDPAVITNVLQREPDYMWLVGSPRKFLNGKPRPGVYEESYWNHTVTIEGRRHFFKEMEKCLAGLEKHARFLTEIVDGGGVISMIANLPGSINIGAAFHWENLIRLIPSPADHNRWAHSRCPIDMIFHG
ncbi:MAG: hypothetical protein O3C34_17830, partial [Proteobacteria bacterium]|nr:hypothetical protein [Pseudomonadota bacterium]